MLKIDAQTNILLRTKYAKRYREIRAEFEALHPDVQGLDQGERIRLWHEFIESFYGPEPEPLCTTCNEGGWVIGGDGKPILCPKCKGKDWEAVKYARLKEFSNLPEAKQEDSFENFKQRLGTKLAFDAVWSLANGEASFRLLLLVGKHGVGKTHLCHAAVNRALERQHISAYWYMPAFYSRWRAEMADPGGPDIFVNNITTCDFLVLDDIGVREATPAQQELLERIVNHRYHEELPLLATTNLDPRELGASILSRFSDALLSKIVTMNVSDYRPQKSHAPEELVPQGFDCGKVGKRKVTPC